VRKASNISVCLGSVPAMNVKRNQSGEYIDLPRLMEAVLELRLRVASLEKVRHSKLLRPHSGLNSPTSSKTNANGRRTRKAGSTGKAC
jgi:hypothetical protein